MSGFNRLLDLFRSREDIPLPTDISRHKGWGRVNQWMDTDAKELADALHESGCNATLCEFLGFSYDNRWKEPEKLFGPARDYTEAMIAKGVLTHWTIFNWNMGQGLPENGKVTACTAFFSDAWFDSILGFFAELARDVGGITVLPCSELGVRNSECRAKGLRWHNKAAAVLGAPLIRWNGNGDASPSVGAGPYGELVEYHVARVSDTGYRDRTLVVTDTSMVLNELGGLRAYVSNHDALARCVRQAQAKGCGFVHYAFDVPGIDFKAIETIGAA